MPLKRYFKGEGQKVMAGMKDRYGDEKGESVFYATANKRNMNPKSKPKSARKPLATKSV